MRSTILFLSLFATTIISSQSLVNGNFENWTTAGSYDNPTGWNTMNQYVVQTTKSTSDKHGGNAALQVQTLTYNGQPFTGIVSTGNISAQGIVKGGTSIASKPTALTGWYKYNTSGNDSGLIQIYPYQTGTQPGAASGSKKFGQTNTWTSFSIPIYYSIFGNPDTMKISIYSSSSLSPVLNTTLLLDDLAYVYPSGIDEAGIQPLGIYPNPVSGNMRVNVKFPDSSYDEKEVLFRVHDMDGKEIYNKRILLNSTDIIQIDLNNSLAKGTYFCSLIDGNKIIAKGSLAVE